ncbi:MAG: hypothetical protein JXR27_08885 [Paludibacteraceae bacterium]|nr:hypothetical protein [Paludibacteraceae bacterium]
MGLFSLYKPKEYKYRYIYYDPKKEAREEKEKQREASEKRAESGEYQPIIRRGMFREIAQQNNKTRIDMARQSNVRLVIIMLLLFAIAYFLLR